MVFGLIFNSKNQIKLNLDLILNLRDIKLYRKKEKLEEMVSERFEPISILKYGSVFVCDYEGVNERDGNVDIYILE